MSKSVMKQIIDYFSGPPLSKQGVNHKHLWLEYLQTGNLPFTPKELHRAIQDIVDKPENRPKGEKLLHFRKRYNFTLKEDKTPYRPEEALERFVIASNGDRFFNQVPVGGGKESIDIVIRHGTDSVEFVELKPWNSNDSPLYAIISMLAPRGYYRKFFLLDDSDAGIHESILRATELLDGLAEEFNTSLSISSLVLSADSFNRACSRIYDQQGLVGQQIASVTEGDNINSLEYSNWAELASSSSL